MIFDPYPPVKLPRVGVASSPGPAERFELAASCISSSFKPGASSARLGSARCQSSGSWLVVEYVTSALNHIGTMSRPASAVLGTAWDAAGERR